MDFTLSDDQVAIQDAARAFAEAELAPHSARWDEEKHFPVEVMRKAAALGFAGIYVQEDVGGSALSRLDASLIFEQLSRGDVSTAAFISIHNMASWMVDRFGSDALRRKYLPRLTTMELIASYCLTEPGSGSDAAAMRTTAGAGRRRLCAERRQGLHLRKVRLTGETKMSRLLSAAALLR